MAWTGNRESDSPNAGESRPQRRGANPLTYPDNSTLRLTAAGVVLLVVGTQLVLTGLLADLVAINRRSNEELLYRARRRDAEASGRQAGS